MDSLTERTNRTSVDGHAPYDIDIARLFESAPGAREAIQQRLAEHPEYRSWLQHFGQSVLHAVE